MSQLIMQQTLKNSITLQGIGLHQGQPVTLTLQPHVANGGIVFIRTDLAAPVEIPAHSDYVQVSALCTNLVKDGVSIATVEHVLSALSGLGIDNAIIQLNAGEVPILDGSAKPFVDAILQTGIQIQNSAKQFIEIIEPVRVQVEDKWATLLPTTQTDSLFSLDFTVEFNHPIFNNLPAQRTLLLSPAHYQAEISPARTFCFFKEVAYMHAHGLALGGSLNNAVVLNDTGVMNPEGLRFNDEMLRHKLLDAVGDLYLAGFSMIGKYQAFKSGHALNNQLLKALFAQPKHFKIVTKNINV